MTMPEILQVSIALPVGFAAGSALHLFLAWLARQKSADGAPQRAASTSFSLFFFGIVFNGIYLAGDLVSRKDATDHFVEMLIFTAMACGAYTTAKRRILA